MNSKLKASEKAFHKYEYLAQKYASKIYSYEELSFEFEDLLQEFRIKIFTGRLLTKDEMIFIGNTILSNEQLVRRLVVLGWDTLEIHGENATYGCKWKLADHIEPINLLNS